MRQHKSRKYHKTLFLEKLEKLQYFIRLLIYFMSVAVMFVFSVSLANFIGVPVWLPFIVVTEKP
jgi:hypothetical protein